MLGLVVKEPVFLRGRNPAYREGEEYCYREGEGYCKRVSSGQTRYSAEPGCTVLHKWGLLHEAPLAYSEPFTALRTPISLLYTARSQRLFNSKLNATLMECLHYNFQQRLIYALWKRWQRQQNYLSQHQLLHCPSTEVYRLSLFFAA